VFEISTKMQMYGNSLLEKHYSLKKQASAQAWVRVEKKPPRSKITACKFMGKMKKHYFCRL